MIFEFVGSCHTKIALACDFTTASRAFQSPPRPPHQVASFCALPGLKSLIKASLYRQRICILYMYIIGKNSPANFEFPIAANAGILRVFAKFTDESYIYDQILQLLYIEPRPAHWRPRACLSSSESVVFFVDLCVKSGMIQPAQEEALRNRRDQT